MNARIVIANKMRKIRTTKERLEEEKQAFVIGGEREEARVRQVLIHRCNRELLELHLEYNMLDAPCFG